MRKRELSYSQIALKAPGGYRFSMSLKLRIRDLRESRGWSLETLAGRVGVSPPHLSQVERGIKNLNNRLIDGLARELDVEPFELFAPAQKRSDIVRILAELSDDDLARVRAFAVALSSTRKPDSE